MIFTASNSNLLLEEVFDLINGVQLRDALISASNNLSNYRRDVDALNIFPVPDGDTGTNMSMTIGAAAREMASVSDSESIGDVAAKAASALLRGARGNSGVILSLIFRGFSKGLKGKEAASSSDIAQALSFGVEAAYKAVMKPTEGTMLTVIRMASVKANECVDDEKDVIDLWNEVVDAADAALQKTPEQLPVLKKAGVVDAGGQGLLYIMQGMQSVFNGNGIVQASDGDTVAPVVTPQRSAVASASDEIEFGYCNEFLIEREKGNEKDALALRAYLESIGDCVVVVDDDSIIKVHVHSNQPNAVLGEALKYGQLINIKIDNMRYQHRMAEGGVAPKEEEQEVKNEIAEPENEYGFVAVAAGDGVQQLFSDLGADSIVSGGQTMNPSTDDIYNAVLATPAKNVFVLPNNKNIILAAEQTIPLIKDRKVHVLHTKTIPQGVSAMLAFDESADSEENHMAMMEAADRVATGLVTFAARDSSVDGMKIKEGQILGMTNGKIKYVENDVVTAAFLSAKHLVNKINGEFVTLIYGDEATLEQAEKVKSMLNDKYGSGVEVTIVEGNQPVYYFIISVE